jgi:hypothetical protein
MVTAGRATLHARDAIDRAATSSDRGGDDDAVPRENSRAARFDRRSFKFWI